MKSARSYSAAELVDLLKKKDQDACIFLYEKYAAPLYGLIKQLTRDETRAIDLLQETLIRIINSADQYNSSKLQLFTWMMQVARQTVFEKLKAGEHRIYPGSAGDNDKTYGGLISILPEDEQQVLRLAYLEGHSIQEVAHKLGIPESTVRSKIRNAVVTLKARL